MRLTKEAAEPIRKYLIAVKNRLETMPPGQSQQALKSLQGKMLATLASRIGDGVPTDADARLLLSEMVAADICAEHILNGRPPEDAGSQPSPARSISPPPPPPASEQTLPPSGSGGQAPPLPAAVCRHFQSWTVKVLVKSQPPENNGWFQCGITPDSLILSKSGRKDIVFPRGSKSAYDKSARFNIQQGQRQLQCTIVSLFKHSGRLAIDMVNFLQGNRPAPVAADYRIPWYFVLLWFLPLGVLLSGIGLVPVAIVLCMSGVCVFVSKCDRMAAVLRVVLSAAVVLAGYAWASCQIAPRLRQAWNMAMTNVQEDRRLPTTALANASVNAPPVTPVSGGAVGNVPPIAPPVKSPVEPPVKPTVVAESPVTTTADYCTVLFARKLFNELNLTLPQRVRLAALAKSLTRETHHVDTQGGTKWDEDLLTAWGTKVRGELSVSQVAAFEGLYRTRELRHVAMVQGGLPMTCNLKYTAYKETQPPAEIKAQVVGGECGVTVKPDLPDESAVIGSPREAMELAGSGDPLVTPVAIRYLIGVEGKAGLDCRKEVHDGLGAILIANNSANGEELADAYCRWTTAQEIPDALAVVKKKPVDLGKLLVRKLLETMPADVEKYMLDNPRDVELESVFQFVAWDKSPQAGMAKAMLETLRKRSIAVGDQPVRVRVRRQIPDIKDLQGALDAIASEDTIGVSRGIRWVQENPVMDKAGRVRLHDALKPLLFDKNSVYRKAVTLFCDVAVKDDMHTLEQLLDGTRRLSSPPVVWQTLMKLDPKETRDFIDANGTSSSFCSQLADGLEEMNSSYEKEVLPMLANRNFYVRQAAIRILGRIGTDKSIMPIQNLYNRSTKREQVRLKEVAVEAVNNIKSRKKTN